MIAPTNIILTKLALGVRLDWVCSGAHETQIYVSVNGGSYSLLHTTGVGVVTYDDETDYFGDTVKYQLRAKGATTVSNFSNAVNDILEFTFISYGDGSGVGEMNLETSITTTATIDGTGRFYTNAAGTEGESTTKVFTAGELTKTYIKVPSGESIMRIKNVITYFGKWDGSYANKRGWETDDDNNSPKLVTDMSKMTHLVSITIFGHNAVYGDITALSAMEVMEIACASGIHSTATYGATVTADVTEWLSITHFDTWDLTHFTGILQSPVLVMLWIGGLSSFSFDITDVDDIATFVVSATTDIHPTGSIADKTSLVYVQINTTNTLEGSIAGLTALEYILVNSGNTITAPNVTNVTKLGYINIAELVLTSENINQILADVWANRDVARVYLTRTLELNKAGSGAATGQGLIDLAALRAYRSPNNDPTKNLWVIVVNS